MISNNGRFCRKQTIIVLRKIPTYWFKTSFVPPSSVADPDPGSGAFLTPGFGIRNRFFPDPGSQIHNFESLLTVFWVKSSKIP
jgi:hypothetical protein